MIVCFNKFDWVSSGDFALHWIKNWFVSGRTLCIFSSLCWHPHCISFLFFYVSTDILACQNNKGICVNIKINDSWWCMLIHCCDLLGHLNIIEALLMLLSTRAFLAVTGHFIILSQLHYGILTEKHFVFFGPFTLIIFSFTYAMCRSTLYFLIIRQRKDMRKHISSHVMPTPAPFHTVLLTFLSSLNVLLFVTLTRLIVYLYVLTLYSLLSPLSIQLN